jgi:hypothetical protein
VILYFVEFAKVSLQLKIRQPSPRSTQVPSIGGVMDGLQLNEKSVISSVLFGDRAIGWLNNNEKLVLLGLYRLHCTVREESVVKEIKG